MKVSEFKLKAVSGINGLIDEYFGDNNIKDKFINSTLKVIVQQNQHKYDSVIDIFTDENGEIDPNVLINQYSNMIGDNGFIIDIRNFIKNEWIRKTLPDKALKINKDDLLNMFK